MIPASESEIIEISLCGNLKNRTVLHGKVPGEEVDLVGILNALRWYTSTLESELISMEEGLI